MDRLTARPGEVDTPAIEQRDGTWHIRALPLVREVLRLSGDTLQAGFAAEVVRETSPTGALPVLFADGADHRDQRSAIARYFAPVTVTRRYETLMIERAERQLARLDGGREVDLADLTLHFSAQVAAQVIGLAESDQERMAHRLVGFFDQPEGMLAAPPQGLARVRAFVRSLPSVARMYSFYLRDVRPAVRARRAAPRQDVISHLVEQGRTGSQILMECLTYGAAGVVTTREFLQIATWHLLDRPALRHRFLVGSAEERSAILHELLRLEPVVGHLYRRTTEELTLTHDGVEHRIPAGARLDLSVRAANADPEQVAPDPLRLCPGRDLPSGIRPEVMSFGDRPHRCPGNAVAMTESEIFLTRLLARDIERLGEPTIGWEDVIAGYAVGGLRLRDRGGRWSPEVESDPR
ncbi:cytochrome P450 [Ornithinimicrobium sp. Y1847]|uniref:cytochrome P450 n=2 Tax=unclassified Ornithinimicrobium TaxID=2615080 RepID=UPI003B672935